MASMPSANPMLVDLNEMENIFQTLFKLIQKICKRDEKEMNPIVQKLYFYFILFQNRFKKDVKEMNDVFVSVENDLDETFKQNELLKDRLLEASLAEDIKNLNFKEFKDVSNESKTADTVCNDAFEVSQGLSKRIVELEKDLSKFKAKRKIEFFKKKQLDISELNKGSGENICDNAKCEFQTKFIELERVLTQQTKDFNDVKLELSKRTAKFEAYFEKLKKMKAVLERQLARKVDDSKAENDQFLKEINHLRTKLEI
ncbi:hypothetical protein Tco_1012353 [Tanacetum coccineum]